MKVIWHQAIGQQVGNGINPMLNLFKKEEKIFITDGVIINMIITVGF